MHFAYLSKRAIKNEGTDLFQGDIIIPPDTVRKRLSSRGYDIPTNLLGYLVISQTCDLVKDRLKATPICCSPIVTLDSILDPVMEELAPVVIGKFRAAKRRTKIDEFLSRLFNQNESLKALFYIHPDTSLGLAALTPAVAILRHKIAFEESDYKLLQRHRKGRFKPEFRAKLGWMVGNIYSRQATTDFDPSELRGMLSEITGRLSFITALQSRRVKSNPGWEGWDDSRVLSHVRETKKSRSKTEILGAVVDVLSANGLDSDLVKRLRIQLFSDERVQEAIGDAETRGSDSAS